MMWLGRAYSDLDRLADENWEWVKSQAGFPADGWKTERLSRRDDPHISSITHCVSHKTAGRFTYKFQLRPASSEAFGTHYRMQEAAYESFPHSAEFTTPQPIFADDQRQVSVLSFLEGKAVSERIRQCRTPQQQLDLVTKCGAWLDAFHRSQDHEVRPFRPAHTLRYYETLQGQIDAKECDIVARPLFLRGIEKLRQLAPRVAGAETAAAMQHGDFHLRNLIWNDGQIAGIDFSKDHAAPVGYDIAKILLDFTTVFRSSDDLAAGQIIHDETMDAFFKGYRLVGADDPGVRFLLYARILATLNTIPAKHSERTEAKHRTLKRLRPFAHVAFEHVAAPVKVDTGKVVRFFLTKRSLDAARQGTHEFSSAVKRALEPKGHNILLRRDTPHNRKQMSRGEYALVHMSDPVGRDGLVFRRAYAGPFWHLEKRSARWEWEIAKKTFVPEAIDQPQAETFFDTWRARLLPEIAQTVQAEDYIYMPLQGRLLQRRSFQKVRPIDMIKATLHHTNLPIKATLHPSEEYEDDELAALDDIQNSTPQFEVTAIPMHTALASCRFVVTENSSAAFHAILYEKPSVLFAKIDFNHICASFDPRRPAMAFEAIEQKNRPFRAYLFWYWAQHCINLEDEDYAQRLVERFNDLGWSIE